MSVCSLKKKVVKSASTKTTPQTPLELNVFNHFLANGHFGVSWFLLDSKDMHVVRLSWPVWTLLVSPLTWKANAERSLCDVSLSAGMSDLQCPMLVTPTTIYQHGHLRQHSSAAH